jgi:quercetin dioxygenase-like cupin family protein
MRALLALLLAACPGGGGGEPVMPQPPVVVADAAVDAAGPSDDEKLAAIQKAMNELDEGAQQCWAVAAVERFDIEGEIAATIDIAGAGKASVAISRDTTNSKPLAACLSQLLAGYGWAPPLYGQAIQLPFRFRAPTGGQNVIDRKLVPWHGQGKIALAVLLDSLNSGNDAASLVEIAIEAGGSTGARRADRAELWLFLGNAKVSGTAVAAGDMMYVEPGASRDVAAAENVHAVIAIVPGGREGSARAGALPTQAGTGKPPKYLPAAKAKPYCIAGDCKKGKVTIFAEPATIPGKQLAASILEMPAGAAVPEHVHANETELLYILSGSGTMTVAGVQLAVTPTSVVQIPPNTRHAFTATADVRALQIYTPAGPEQRFKAKP